MSNITKHNTKQEREDRNGIQSWIYLLISRNTVSVDDLLERSSEGICLNVSRVFGLGLHLSQRNKGREDLVQQSSFLLLYPYLAHHDVVCFLK